jgi:hypothetical protein
MAMRFRGGGVGHTSTRGATNSFLSDRGLLDLVAADDENEDDFDGKYTQGANDGENDSDEQEGCSDIEENEDPNEDEGEWTDDALGPDDGEVDDDEVAALGYAAF